MTGELKKELKEELTLKAVGAKEAFIRGLGGAFGEDSMVLGFSKGYSQGVSDTLDAVIAMLEPLVRR